MEQARSSFLGNFRAIALTLDDEGLDGLAIARSVGLDPDWYSSPARRVPAQVMTSFQRASIEATSDPLFALRCVENLTPASYHALGTGLMFSSSLRSFFQRFERFFPLITTMYEAEFRIGPNESLFTWRRKIDVPKDNAQFDDDSFVGVVLRYLRYTAGSGYAPCRVALAGARPNEAHEAYHELLRCDVEFDAAETGVVVSSAELDVALNAGNRELANQSDQAVLELLSRSEDADVAVRVYSLIVESMAEGTVARQSVAAALNMSSTALYESLKSSGTTFQEVLDRARRDVAELYLERDELSLTEIAYLVGFSDSTNFARAFRRLTGQSPGEFRDAVHPS
ncbi:MAG: AraC family transcriptional regulator ligand-binding domain-containing protein [Acidimicrobiales bacterium]|nr:AraC family transcriptional regulator ligand-binding domain-containing protein [Acidimicrobiales bacterium]